MSPLLGPVDPQKRESTWRTPSGRTRPEFRVEAIRLAREPGHSIRRVAMDLGISNESLRAWVVQDEIERGDGPD